MLLLVGAYLASLLPALAMYCWVRSLKSDEAYRRTLKRALLNGLRSVLPVLLFSGSFALLERFIGLKGADPVYERLYRCFLVFAFSEELAKYLAFKRALKQARYEFSRLDAIIFCAIAALGFELIESLVYAFGTNAPQMIVRGVTLMHFGYGFIMGYFETGYMKTGDKRQLLAGLLIPMLLHGLYDYSLTPELETLNHYIPVVGLALAFFSMVLVVVFILFVRKHRDDPRFAEPL